LDFGGSSQVRTFTAPITAPSAGTFVDAGGSSESLF
jgi:hypothetical protein